MPMIYHREIGDPEMRMLIKAGVIRFAGNKRLKIYGHLDCRTGKYVKREYRVFFESEAEAIAAGYRPCGLCMRDAYRAWRQRRDINGNSADHSGSAARRGSE